MTRPRCLEPRQTYLITRRCTQRRFLLRPDALVNNLLLYLLSLAAERHEIEIHAFVFLSNHYHLVLSETSKTVRLPEFMGWFNQHAAALLNEVRDRRENLWAQGSYNAVVLADAEAVVDEIVYTICNPVAAGLVEAPESWKGLLSLPDTIERGVRVARHPKLYFKTELPEETRLRLTRPPGFRGRQSAESFRKLIADKVRDRVCEIHAQRRAEGKGAFLGMEAVLAQDTEASPRKAELSSSKKPLVACKDRERREKILLGLKQFQASHGEALKDWRAGKREVAFPVGTYGMVRFHKARCLQGPGVFSLE